MKHAVIVGASRGLGRSLVEEALRRAEQVTAICRSGGSPVKAPNITTLYADVRYESELASATQALSLSPPIDVLIYNAAVHLESPSIDIEQVRPEAMLETLNVNSVGAARVVKHFRRHLCAHGLLVMISSEAGSIRDARRTSEYGYCMSKAALNMLAKLLSEREAQRETGVQVIAMHPGWVRTDMGGPNADISSAESAKDIFDTLEARATSPGPIFMDRLGGEMAW